MATKAFSLFGVFMALALLATLVVSVLPGRNNDTASAAVAGLTIVQSTFNPGASTRVTATFTTTASLATNAGTVTLTFPDGYTVAPTRAQIFISDVGIAVPVNPAIDPAIVGRAVTITIPDMDPGTTSVNDPLSASVGAGHTVLITGGIINPSSAGTKTYKMVSSKQGSVPAATAEIVVPTRMTLSPTRGARGTLVTASGSGFSAGTATVFLDENGDTVLDATEPILASATVASNGTFSASFTATVGPFVPDANTIGVVDGRGAPLLAAVKFIVTRSISLTPSTGPVGTSVTITLRDFGAADLPIAANSTTIGGVATVHVSASPITVIVPAGTPIGSQSVAVTTVTADVVRATFIVAARDITVSPSTGVVGGNFTLAGTGFTANGTVAAAAVNITSPAGRPAPATPGWNAAEVNIASDGSFTAVLPLVVANLSAASRAGTYTITVTDNAGIVGTGTFTVPGRTLTLSPTSSDRGTIVTATGTGYSATSVVTVTYHRAAAGTALSSSSGDFSADFVVPANAVVGKNTVAARDARGVAGPTTVKHTVARRAVLTPDSGEASSTLQAGGWNYTANSAMAFIIGGQAAVPATGIVTTDALGNFDVTLTVPTTLRAGPTVLTATDGGGLAVNSTFTVLPVPTSRTIATALPAAFNTSAQLNSIFGLDAAGASTVYNPARPAALNTLDTLVRGDGYFVITNVDTTLTIGSVSYTFTTGVVRLIGFIP